METSLLNRVVHRSVALALSACVMLASPAQVWANDGPKMSTSTEMGEVKTASEADLATARLHFSNGVSLLREIPPNYQDAWQQFRLALEKSGGSWKVRGNLGYCALKLERDGEALEHYRHYLQAGGAELDPKERSDIEQELLLLEGNMAWVTISSSDPDAEIAVSRRGSSAPTQAYSLSRGEAKLGLRAGDFMITAKSGARTLKWEPLLTPGKKASFHFDFGETETAAARRDESLVVKPAASEEQRARPTTLRLVGYGALGAGVLAAGGGVIAGVVAKNKEKAAQENCVNKICPEDDLPKKESAQTLALTANILYITGGVLAATGVTLVILDVKAKQNEVARTLHLSPGIAAGGGALFLSGSY